jgi:hypothetical protein
MRTQVKRTRMENPDAFIRLNTECDWMRLNMIEYMNSESSLFFFIDPCVER